MRTLPIRPGIRIAGLLLLLATGLLPASPAGAASENDPLGQMNIRVQIKAENSTLLASPMAGRLESFPFKDSQHFDKGQTLARIDCSVQQAQLAKAKAAADKKSKVAAITSQLRALKAKSAMEVEVAQAEAAEGAAEVRVAQALANRCVVTAPFSGKVVDVQAKENQFVPEGHGLLEIVDDRAVSLECIVPSSWLRWLRPGQEFEVFVEELDRRYTARVSRLGGKVDPVSRSVKLYAVIEGDQPELVHGMSGAAVFHQPQ